MASLVAPPARAVSRVDRSRPPRVFAALWQRMQCWFNIAMPSAIVFSAGTAQRSSSGRSEAIDLQTPQEGDQVLDILRRPVVIVGMAVFEEDVGQRPGTGIVQEGVPLAGP